MHLQYVQFIESLGYLTSHYSILPSSATDEEGDSVGDDEVDESDDDAGGREALLLISSSVSYHTA